MCGFLGINRRVEGSEIRFLSEGLRHRGPDGNGEYVSDAMTLAHRRLSIIDLEGGGQPLSNEDGTAWIVFNGEMYNYQEEGRRLRERGHVLKTQSDTEVILHLYEEMGVESLHRINGDFAIAIWDERRKQLLLARDRFGIKPLYYFFHASLLVFASEIRAILRVPAVPRRVNPQAVSSYFHFRYNLGEESFFSGIRRLPPGSYALYRDGRLTLHKYYSVRFCGEPKAPVSPGTAGEKICELLTSSVRYRLIADVEVGLFLSSGIDSTAVLSLASSFQQRLKAFTIGFGFESDEVEKAEEVAKSSGAEFFPLRIEASHFDLLSEIVGRFDEPVGDSIIIPTYLLAQAASRRVKAVLTGEGADEVLGGYIHQLTFYYLEKFARHLPQSLLLFISHLVRRIPLAVLNIFFPYPDRLREGDREKVARVLRLARDFYATRRTMISLFEDNEFAGEGLKSLLPENGTGGSGGDTNFFFREMDMDLTSWLTYYTLYKQDTLTMAHSLEGRVPYLDHRLVEYLATLPAEFFIRWAKVKMPLREAMRGTLPAHLLSAKKKAFYFPYHRFFPATFREKIAELHQDAKRDADLAQLLNLDVFERLVGLDPGKLSLQNSKRLMAYIIFLTWYRKHFVRS
jgi:asparagine synthase (glutamine-hydrolysing)